MTRTKQDHTGNDRSVVYAARLAQALASHGPTKEKGMIWNIRRALGMSARQLGQRLGVSQSAVSQYERGEVSGSITLSTLKQVAEALECDLVYSLVPRQDLNAMRKRQARELASSLMLVYPAQEAEKKSKRPKKDLELVTKLVTTLLSHHQNLLWEDEVDLLDVVKRRIKTPALMPTRQSKERK